MKWKLPERYYRTLQSLLKMWHLNIYKALRTSSLQTRTGNVSTFYFFIYYSYSEYHHRSVIKAYFYQSSNVQKLPHAYKSYPVHKMYSWNPFSDHKFHLLTALCFWMAGKQFRKWNVKDRKVATMLISVHFIWGSFRGCVFLLAIVYSRIKGSYKDESEVDWHSACLNYFHYTLGFGKD